MKQIILFSFLLLSTCTLFAQFDSRPMKVGEVLPLNFWSVEHQVFEKGKVLKKSLEAFKGKIIVLDFWATWCGPCIADMPKQREVLKNYSKEIEVVRISSEKEEQMQLFSKSKKNHLGNELTTIISDLVLNKCFPHEYIPHLVWIDKDGEILGFTTADSFTKINIDKIISGENSLTSYYDLKENTPLFMEQLPKQTIAINIVVKGKLTGLSAGYEKRETDKSSGILIKNSTLRNTYSMVARRTFPWYSTARMVLDFLNTNEFENLKNLPEDVWTIDFWQPKTESCHLYQNLVNFLNTNCGYVSSVEVREQKCLILKYNSSNPSALISKGGVGNNTVFGEKGKITNGKVEWFRVRLEEQPWVGIPVMDETGINFQIDLNVPMCNDLKMLNSYLNIYGISAVPENRSIPMVVIRKKGKS